MTTEFTKPACVECGSKDVQRRVRNLVEELHHLDEHGDTVDTSPVEQWELGFQYECCECTHAWGAQGVMSPKARPQLDNDDWVELYYALESKRDDLDPEDTQWRDHLSSILDRIGPDGRNMYEDSHRGE